MFMASQQRYLFASLVENIDTRDSIQWKREVIFFSKPSRDIGAHVHIHTFSCILLYEHLRWTKLDWQISR
jgi:hypothetical protein